MDRVEEQQLLKQAQRGSAEAFSRLYQSHVQVIFRYIHYRVNDVQMAEDLTSEVFMRALAGLSSYQDRGKPFVAWLYSIAHARIVDYYRRGARQTEESEQTLENIAVTPDMDKSMLRRQAVRALREAIATLTDEQQQVVILRFIEGYHIEEVAQLIGKNANAIKALQHRALRTLASRLAKTGLDLETLWSGLF
ncbi:MAG: sigma-70 family RNA polymerase sigma factor [Chloroflexi bacterium]|nr:sigma-70 family RNA polymerase sigma factor [Chloroflexota bacterium]